MTTFVGQLMSSPVKTIERDATAVEAAQAFIEDDVGSLIVVDDGMFHGILTGTDILALIATENAPGETAIDEYVTEDVVTVTPETALRDAAHLLFENNIHHLPVISVEKEIKGVLSTADVAEYLSNTRESAY